jgi:uroporphyrinogen-III synthase
MNSLPLAGRRVLVTRALHQAGSLSDGLRALGAEPVEVPVLEIHPPPSFDAMDAALGHLGSYDWLILTSANAVRALTGRAAVLGITLEQPSRLKVAAVGSATASAARKAGFQVAFVPEKYVAESLAEGLIRRFPPAAERPEIAKGAGFSVKGTGFSVKGTGFSPYIDPAETTGALQSAEKPDVLKGHDFSRAVSAVKSTGALAPEESSNRRILLARAAVARDVIPDALRAAGAVVDLVDAYSNVLPEAAPEQLRCALATGIAAATFTSSSSAKHLAEAARQARIAWPLAAVAAVSIGPITSQTLVELGWEPAAEAVPSDIPGLIAAVERVLLARVEPE